MCFSPAWPSAASMLVVGALCGFLPQTKKTLAVRSGVRLNRSNQIQSTGQAEPTGNQLLSPMKQPIICLLSCAATIIGVFSVRADPLDTWQWRNPSPQGNSLTAVAFGQGRFVAVGGGGTIISSLDGTNWTLLPQATANSLANVAFLNNRFVAVGERGTILYSTTGTNWVIAISGVTNSLTAASFGGGSYLVVGHQGTVLRSNNAFTWSQQSGIANTLFLNSVAYGAGTFVAISSLGQVIQSYDGSFWNTLPALGGYPTQIAYLNGRFIVMDESMWSSPDGLTWTSTWVNPAPDAVTFANGHYVGIGASGIIQVSANGTNWSWMTANQSSGDLKGIAYGNNLHVAVGATGLIRTSSDRTNWFFQHRALSNGGTLYDVEFANGEFVAVGEGLVGAGGILERSPLLFSGPATDWQKRDSGSFSTLYNIAYGQGLYVMASSFGIQSSINGSNWVSRSSGLSSQLASVNFVNGLFLLTGWNGALSTSLDGLTWTRRTNASTRTLMDSTFGKGLYVIVGRTPGGSSGSILTSEDTINWTNRSAGNLNGVCYSEAQQLFVAVGDGGHIRTSTNAVNWTTRNSFVTASLWGIRYADRYFAAVGDQGTLLTSPDGTNWTQRTTRTVQSLQRITYGRGTFVAVGGGSTVLQSAPTVPTLQFYSVAANQVGLQLLGGFDRPHILEAATNPAADWFPIANLTAGQRDFLDTDNPAVAKFYRARVP